MNRIPCAAGGGLGRRLTLTCRRADVSLNGMNLARLVNAHRAYDLQLPSGLLDHGLNNLSITVWSALEHSEQQARAYPYPIPHAEVRAG